MTLTRPKTVPTMPIVGASAPAWTKGARAGRVALAHGLVLGVEHGGDEVGVRAVDDELQALLGERVLDVLDGLVEGQQAVAARLLGVADELVDAADEVGVVGHEGLHVELGS